MQYFRTMMLTAGLFAWASVVHASPPTKASTQGLGDQQQAAKASLLEVFLAQFMGSAKPSDGPAAVINNTKAARCEACEPTIVRDKGPQSAQAAKSTVAIQASEQGRDTCMDWGCIRFPSSSEIAAALMRMRDQASSPGLKAFFQVPMPMSGEAIDAKPVTVVRVPGVPLSTPLPPPFPIAHEIMPIVASPMPMPHRIVPIASLAKHVHFVTPDLEAHCERMTHRGDVVVLEGDVKLHCKKHGQSIRIEAQRVILNMKDGTFTVESEIASSRATARMALPPLVETRQMQWMLVPPSVPTPVFGPYHNPLFKR